MRYIEKVKTILYHQTHALQHHAQAQLSQQRSRLRELSAALSTLNPTAILARGYSITRVLPGGEILRDVARVQVGQQVDVRLSSGRLTCDVKEKSSHGKTDL